ncbi:CopD family protein [Acidimicrobiia bacterium EGI L10123]|uniref:CopD family protein n=1 Tax=Salinilacustrithrix flava TaxID=2957203 RepID=UPI003D7C2626|nr:CopD family protein [Acidimicrobiia bacterium EGI L10123]
MVLAAYADTGYNILLLLHIVAVIAAFAPTVVNPLLERHLARQGGDTTLQSWAGFAHDYTKKIVMGSLVVALLTGILMIVVSDEVIEFSDTWISLSFLVWFAIAGVVSGMVGKGQRLLASGDAKGRDVLAKAGPIVVVLLLVMLYLMIFKPGA